MTLSEENELLRASLDAMAARLHAAELERNAFLKQAKTEAKAAEVLRKEVTRHNKRCRVRKRQALLLLQKLSHCRTQLKLYAAGFYGVTRA